MNATPTATKGRAIGLALIVAMFGSLLGAPASAPPTDMVDVIIRTVEGASIASTGEQMGGTITATMPAIDSVTADIPLGKRIR